MADKSIGSLQTVPQLNNGSFFVVEQLGKAMKVTGAQVKGFAQDAVKPQVEAAKQAATQAEQSSASATAAVKAAQAAQAGAAASAGEAKTSEAAAKEAQQVASDSASAAGAAQSGAEAAKNAAALSEQEAQKAATEASSAAQTASSASAAAGKSATDAATAKAGADTAKAEAEKSKTAAATSEQNAANAEKLAQASAVAAAEAIKHGPKIVGGTWHVWDASQGAYVDTGIKATGENGKDFTILGYYKTLDELRAAHPNPESGENYGVGTEPPYHVYTFDGVSNDWIDNGTIQGPVGPAGADGKPGDPGKDGRGVTSISYITATNKWRISYTDGDFADIDGPTLFSGVYGDLTGIPRTFPPSAHNQSANSITSGTFAGQVAAKAGSQPPGVYCVRNQKVSLVPENPTVEGQICWIAK